MGKKKHQKKQQKEKQQQKQSEIEAFLATRNVLEVIEAWADHHEQYSENAIIDALSAHAIEALWNASNPQGPSISVKLNNATDWGGQPF